MVTSVERHTWSNYNEYIERNKMTNTDFVLDMFNKNKEQAIKSFIEYINKPNDDVCLEISEKRQNTDEEARIIIKIFMVHMWQA